MPSMPKNFLDPNPGMSVLTDGPTKQKLAALAQHALEMADRAREPHYATPEQVENEQFQAHSNALAEVNPFYSAARSASTHFLVLPLEPNKVDPLIDPKAASNDSRTVFEWWSMWPDANIGVALGRVAGLWAIRIEDDAALDRLRDMASVEMHDDNDKRWTEYKEIGGASVRFFAPSRPFSVRSRGGGGREFDRQIAQMIAEDRQRRPQLAYLVYGYHSVVSGQDAHDFKARTIGQGLRVMGEGEVIPWTGSVLEGGVTVAAPGRVPDPAPLWLAKLAGRARSRKVMAAAREQHEATLRMEGARSMALEAQLRILENEAREQAITDRKIAEKVLADEMAKS
jgi:hypothetical protein